MKKNGGKNTEGKTPGGKRPWGKDRGRGEALKSGQTNVDIGLILIF